MPTAAEIEELALAFRAGTLPRSRWTHREHLLVALWYLRHYPPGQSAARFREGLLRYNHQEEKYLGSYHETITASWIALIRLLIASSVRCYPISSLADDLLSRYGRKDYLLRHYSPEILFSPTARRRWVAPDREALG